MIETNVAPVRTPRVSIGLPVYNGERYLAQALDSLLAQTYTDFELIISDNASTDGTAEICWRYAGADARIRYHRAEQNQGAAWNYNRVFQLARGEYFKWAAYDDLCEPTCLEQCVGVLDTQPGVVWTHPRSVHIDASGQRVADCPIVSYRRGSDSAGRQSPSPAERFADVLLGPQGCVDIYGLIRSSAMRRTSLHLPYYGADKVFVAELSLQGEFREISEVLFSIRVHAEGSGSLPTAAQQQQFINPLARRRTWTRLKLLGGYVRAVRRSPISAFAKACCLVVVLRYLLQVKKWGAVVRKTLCGRGTGGGYLEMATAPTTGTTVRTASVQSPQAEELALPVGSAPAQPITIEA